MTRSRRPRGRAGPLPAGRRARALVVGLVIALGALAVARLGLALHELAAAKQGEILFFRTPELPVGLYTVEAVVFDAVGARSSTRVSSASSAAR